MPGDFIIESGKKRIHSGLTVATLTLPPAHQLPSGSVFNGSLFNKTLVTKGKDISSFLNRNRGPGLRVSFLNDSLPYYFCFDFIFLLFLLSYTFSLLLFIFLSTTIYFILCVCVFYPNVYLCPMCMPWSGRPEEDVRLPELKLQKVLNWLLGLKPGSS